MNAWQARLAVRCLRRGGLVLHATEGVWGFACDPFDSVAVERLLQVKGRVAAKGFIVIGAGSECFEPELAEVDPAAREDIAASWPGAVTWILPNSRFPTWITGGRDTVAARVPGHPQARALCRAFGRPLVSSSANRGGRPPARRRIQARALLTDLTHGNGATWSDVHLLPGETLGRQRPSDLRTLSGRTIERER